MNDINKQTKSYCIERGYFVSVYQDRNINGCTAVFPARTIFKNKTVESTSFYEITKLGIEYFYMSDNGETKQANIECPDYSKRVLIFSDVLSKTLALGMSPKLIVSYDFNHDEIKEEGFMSCLNAPVNETDIELEGYFGNLFYKFLSDPDTDYSDIAKKHGVEQGYNLLTLPFLRKDFE